MGTKSNPGQFDYYANALPDEPMFVMLARDPDFFDFVSTWAQRRYNAIRCGDRPDSDRAMVDEATKCAFEGARWRKTNLGIWRRWTPHAPE